MVNLLRYRNTLLRMVLCSVVLANLVFLSGTAANRQFGAEQPSSEKLAEQNIQTKRTFTSNRRAVEAKARPFVGNANGKAFIVNESERGVSVSDIRTSKPVFKALGLTKDKTKLLYISLRKGIPTGELFLEDLITRKARKVTSKLVLDAALSPTDNSKVAFTYAGGESFGLAVADVDTNETKVLLTANVFAEKIEWNDDGKGVFYFETPPQDINLTLDAQYILADDGMAGDLSEADLPSGFPLLKKDDVDPEYQGLVHGPPGPQIYGFQISAPSATHRVIGDNLLGAGNLSALDESTGETIHLAADAHLVDTLSKGVMIKQFSVTSTELKYVSWYGTSTSLALTPVNYNLPVENSTMVQGGAAYNPPGSCAITAHSATMEYAYDFQSPVVGAHVLAAADGLVVFNTSSVSCNTIDTSSCPDYNAGGCPGTYLGNVVIIQHADGTYSKYAHMQLNSPQVAVGTNACQGLYIGRQGHTGSTSGTFNGCGDHVHFQRQTSPDIFGQSIAVDFTEGSNPLSCGTSYNSASTEVAHSIATNSQSFGISGGSGSVNLTSTGCTWSATSNDAWITITSAASGSGNRVVTFSVANNSGGPRTGTMNLGGHIFTVSQSGTQPPNQAPTANAGSDQTITLPSSSNLSGNAGDDGLPNPPATLATTWTKVSGPGIVGFGNANALSTSASFSMAGIYVLRLTASDGSLSATDDLQIVVNTNIGGGMLTASQTAPPSNRNLNTEGTTDWAHWGFTNATTFNHKNNVPQQISNFTQIGSITPLRYTNNPNSFSWSGGTPRASASNTTTGVYVYNVGNGFQITVPATTSQRTLKLYVGVWAAGGYFEATLSDGSASPYLNTSILSAGTMNGVYTVNYRAASPSQTLTVRWLVNSSSHSVGNVTLQAATLVASVAPTPTPTPSPTPTPTPTPNLAPSVNAGNDQSITLPSVATLTGSSTDDGLPNPPATLITTWSKLSGPGTVTFGNANSLSTTASFSQSGAYVLRLTASDSALVSTDDVAIAVSPQGAGGSLSGSSGVPTANTNLTNEGTGDWAHWGLTTPTSFDHKNGVTPQISNYSVIGSGAVEQFGDNGSSYTWSDGTPTLAATNSTTGVAIIGQDNGFRFTVPADTAQRTLKIHVGLWAAGGKLEATLSDNSAPAFVDTSVIDSANALNRVFTLNYRAGSAGQLLTIKWTTNSVFSPWSLVTLQAATLVGSSGPPVNQAPSVNAGNDQSVTYPNPASLSGTASDDGLPNPPAALTTTWTKISGPGTVTFGNANAPSTSATFSSSGTYVLRLNGNDGALAASDDLTVTVTAPGPAGSGEFQISSSVISAQFVSHIASGANGDFIVAWHSSQQDGSGFGVYARRYDTSGNPIGSEFQVNTFTANNQFVPRIGRDATGSFTIVWESQNQDGSGYGIYGQRYNASGVSLGSEFRINTTTANDQHDPFIAMEPNGTFVVVWVSDLQDGNLMGIVGQRFDANGVAIGSEFQVNTYATGDQEQPGIAMDSNGNFAVVWESNGQDGGGKGIYAQRFNALAVPQGAEFKVNTFVSNEQSNAWISMTPTGDFIVTWASFAQDGSGFGIYAQRYNAAGVAQGGEFRVNTYASSDQIYATSTAAPNGSFVIAWESISQDGSGRGVFGQNYDSAGIPQGSEFQINTYTTDNQFNPCLSTDANGNFVVAWNSNNQDGSVEGVFGKRFSTSSPPPVNQAPTVNAGNDQAITLPAATNLSGTASDDGLPNPPATMTTNWSFVSGPGSVTFGNANSVTTSASFSSAGSYLLRLTASDSSFTTSDDVVVTVSSPPPNGGLSGSIGPAVPTNLSTEGSADWAHWGLTAASGFNHKVTATQQISDYSVIGTGSIQRYTNNTNSYSWSGGTPTSAANNTTTGVYVIGLNNGFQLTVPADTTQRTLKVYVGLWAAGGKLEASLSDNSSPAYTDTSLINTSDTANGIYTLNYQAASNGQTLTVKWTVDSIANAWSNVTLQAATLVNGIPPPPPPPPAGEFQISSSVNSAQFVTHVASGATGNFIVTWHSFLQDGSGFGVYGRRYDAAGVPIGNEFRINTYTQDNQTIPRIALDSAGNFVMIWESENQDGSGYGIYGQRYNSAGTPVGSEFRVNTTTTNSQHGPFVAMAPDGTFVVIWVSDFQDGDQEGIFGQRFDATGVPVGGEFQINTFTAGIQRNPGMAMDANGNFIVVWESIGQDGSDKGVYAQRFNALAVPQGPEFRVNTFTVGLQGEEWVSMTPTGEFIVTWSSVGQDGSGSGIYAQRYNAAGASQGGEFQVNTYTFSDQIFGTTSIAPNGNFVIAWESISQDGNGRGVFGQRYDAAGVPQGSEFQINTYTTDNQFSPYLTTDANGNFVVAWISSGQDGSVEGVFGKRYDAAGNPR
ncbi:MAG: peptidoglycan DD-metalloendopeptidase family protein [Pyrinomonadaceae bacterium]